METWYRAMEMAMWDIKQRARTKARSRLTMGRAELKRRAKELLGPRVEHSGSSAQPPWATVSLCKLPVPQRATISQIVSGRECVTSVWRPSVLCYNQHSLITCSCSALFPKLSSRNERAFCLPSRAKSGVMEGFDSSFGPDTWTKCSQPHFGITETALFHARKASQLLPRLDMQHATV